MIRTILKKELKDIIRDSKALVLPIILPFLLPILAFVLVSFNSQTTEESKYIYEIIINDLGDSNIPEILSKDSRFNITEDSEGEEAIKDNKAHVFIEIPKDFDVDNTKVEASSLNLVYDNKSVQSSLAILDIKEVLNNYENYSDGKHLEKHSVEFNEINIPNKVLMFSLLGLLPGVIFLICSSNVGMVAVDIGAGEKERDSIAPLLATKVNRLNLAIGKVAALFIFGVAVAILNVVALLATVKIMGIEFDFNNIGVTVIIIVLALFTTWIFGVINLALSVVAKSFREAQAYLIPVIGISIGITMLTTIIDVNNIWRVMAFIPLVNISFLMKQILFGIYDPFFIATTLIIGLIVAYILFLLVERLFNRENIIFRS